MKTLKKIISQGLVFSILIFAFSCKNEKEVATPEPASTSMETELAFPGKKGVVMTAYIDGEPVPVEKIDNFYVYQGDILLNEEDLINPAARTTGVGKKTGRWPNATLYYTIGSSISSAKRQRILDAIAHWQANTNIKFIQRTNQANYCEFVNSSGCSSNVGMIGGKQTINIGDGCSVGNIIHEIGHALGLHHEQVRIDRDNHVTIHYQNIQSGYEHNFNKASSSSYFDHENFDFGSIMMYGPYSFSVNGQPTITRKNGSTYTVQRNALSTGDKNIIKTMYPGGTSTNLAPSVSITSPISGTSLNAPASFTIQANATDSDGIVSRVEFFVNGTKVGERTATPYSLSISNLSAGSYTLTAKATDNLGASKTSAGVSVTVKSSNNNTCGNVAAYDASKIYAAPGNRVHYQGKIFENKWWVLGEAPNINDIWGPWKFISNCN
ncbi:MAG TPA: M12 family metallopeptidase [Cytophagaceae bacterium]